MPSLSFDPLSFQSPGSNGKPQVVKAHPRYGEAHDAITAPGCIRCPYAFSQLALGAHTNRTMCSGSKRLLRHHAAHDGELGIKIMAQPGMSSTGGPSGSQGNRLC